MKKLISTLLCLSVMTGIVPLSSSAVSEPIYIEDGAESWSKTYISGDVNDDGKVSIADAVILQKCIMNNYDPWEDDEELDEEKLDINFDGVFDVFDLVQMRQYVLHPETAPTQTWAIDMLECDGVSNETEVIITDYQEMLDYLATFENASLSEILKYNQRYNRKFFEENNLILKPFVQERGNGVFYEIVGTGRVNDFIYQDEEDNDVYFNGILFGINPEYDEYDTGLYPVTNTPMLAQIAVPKSQSSEDDMVVCLDFSYLFSPDISSYSYTSPDGETEIYITQESFLLAGSVELYLKNPDGSFTYLTYLATDDGCQPFSYNGEWSVDEDGNSVFGDGERYSITWKQDGVVLDHLIDCYVWENIFVSFDGETIQRDSYDIRNK